MGADVGLVPGRRGCGRASTFVFFLNRRGWSARPGLCWALRWKKKRAIRASMGWLKATPPFFAPTTSSLDGLCLTTARRICTTRRKGVSSERKERSRAYLVWPAARYRKLRKRSSSATGPHRSSRTERRAFLGRIWEPAQATNDSSYCRGGGAEGEEEAEARAVEHTWAQQRSHGAQARIRAADGIRKCQD